MKQRTFSPYRESLEEIAVRFGFARESVKIVDSIADYCASIGHAHLESSTDRVAKCITSQDGVPTFLLCDHADPTNVMATLIAHKFPLTEIRPLNDPAAFARHQLLHEIAHILRRDLHAAMAHNHMEEDCDRWAFE